MPDIKSEIIKRLGHIQKLAKQKNYAEIEKLLAEGYVWQASVISMVSNSGSLLVHVPQVSGLRTRERVRIVGRAVVRVAELLGADIEVFQKRHLLSVWVYYRNGERELSPVYIDWGKDWGEHEVFNSMRSELSRFAQHLTNPVLQSPQVS